MRKRARIVRRLFSRIVRRCIRAEMHVLLRERSLLGCVLFSDTWGEIDWGFLLTD
jgi:hypothetical protein